MREFKTVGEAVAALKKHEKSVGAFYDDPMTAAIGAPTDDFQMSFDRKERAILSFIIKRTKEGSRRHQMALDRMEKWFP